MRSQRIVLLIGFCYASDRAYAKNSGGEVKVSLMKSKAEVASLKYLSTARLELFVSMLLTQLLTSNELPSAYIHTPYMLHGLYCIVCLVADSHS